LDGEGIAGPTKTSRRSPLLNPYFAALLAGEAVEMGPIIVISPELDDPSLTHLNFM